MVLSLLHLKVFTVQSLTHLPESRVSDSHAPHAFKGMLMYALFVYVHAHKDLYIIIIVHVYVCHKQAKFIIINLKACK